MRTTDPPRREITPEALYLRRRDFIRNGIAGGLALSLPLSIAPSLLACGDGGDGEARAAAAPNTPVPLEGVKPAPAAFRVDDEWTDYGDATSYNNFYEFGTDKRDPKRNAGSFRTKPWSVAIEGEVAKPGSVPLETLLAPHPLEERIYRLRCVEAWSMVIPWVGIPLGDVLARFEPTSKAKYVAFETLHDPERMPGQRPNVLGRSALEWPYREGLRIDEAMHPLAILAVGMYGKTLPNQNGAPLRLVVPWKYGFKSIKSIVRIRLTEEQPEATWNEMQPREYGFYANVNPAVDHPRWSQKRERRIGELAKRETLPFNGYAEQVASLYAGMDLREFY